MVKADSAATNIKDQTIEADADVVEIVKSLSTRIEADVALSDESDAFAGNNLALLKQAGLIAAGVPVELGGKGAGIAELTQAIRLLAHSCGSTALAFSVHTHQVAIPAWRWRHQNATAVEPLLRRVAAEKLMLLSSGGSDWVAGSGSAKRVDGGYLINARKVFTSGATAGDLLMTGAIVDGDTDDRQVIHFAVPMKAPEFSVLNTWQVLGMRSSGSNDVQIEGLFVPDSSIVLTRKAGEWHPMFHLIATIALPLIYSAYVGVAEKARDIAIEMAKKKRLDHYACDLAGRMDTSLRAAQLAHKWMIEIADRNVPSSETVNEVMIGRSLVAEHAIKTVELAMELAGGAGFYRKNSLERLFRDVQGARYHPMQQGRQSNYAGAMALGLPVRDIF